MTPEEEHDAVARMVETAGETREAGSRVWNPSPQVAFGRCDVASDGYGDALDAARELGLPPVVRNSGGRAVVHHGSTVAFALALPSEEPRLVERRYERVVDPVGNALEVETRCGERGFCPGGYSLHAPGNGDAKLGGVAQRVTRHAALVSGVVIVRRDGVERAFERIYEALGVEFDPSTVGSVSEAGGPSEVGAVVEMIEESLV